MSKIFIARQAWFDAKLDLENEFGKSYDCGFSCTTIDLDDYDDMQELYDMVYADSYYWNKVDE